MDVASGSGQQKRRALLAFDLASIPPGSAVESAALTVCATSVPSAARTYEVYRVDEAWSETVVTWAGQPALAATASASAETPLAPGCVTWSVTGDVQAWVDGAAANFGWCLRDQAEGTGPAVTTFRSREDLSVADEQPTLAVTYVPPPQPPP